MCVCVCVCVKERKRERGCEREKEREVCVKERASEWERKKERKKGGERRRERERESHRKQYISKQGNNPSCAYKMGISSPICGRIVSQSFFPYNSRSRFLFICSPKFASHSTVSSYEAMARAWLMRASFDRRSAILASVWTSQKVRCLLCFWGMDDWYNSFSLWLYLISLLHFKLRSSCAFQSTISVAVSTTKVRGKYKWVWPRRRWE